MPIRRLYVKYIGFIDVICFYFIPYLNYFPYFLLNIEKIDKTIEFFLFKNVNNLYFHYSEVQGGPQKPDECED